MHLPAADVLAQAPSWLLKWSKFIAENKQVTSGTKVATLVALDAEGNETPIELALTAPCTGWVKEQLYKPIKGQQKTIVIDPKKDANNLLLTFTETLQCKHDVILNGLCAVCGEIVLLASGVAANPEDRDTKKDMVTLGFVSQEKGLQVSQEVAHTLTASKIGKLLRDQKLVLVLDLDNTLAHAHEEGPPTDLVRGAPGEQRLLSRFDDELATFMDAQEKNLPFDSISVIDAQDWGPNRLDHFMIDYESDGETPILAHYVEEDDPNYPLASSIISVLESQVLLVQTMAKIWRADGVVHQTFMRPSFFKLRPGVIKFLRDLSKIYELYMYTAGTMEHAESALKLLDPQRKFFGTRVFARTSLNGDGTKSLGQILPTDHEMIVVVDDTRRVWSPDVGLFVCYPYMWFHDYLWHFLVPTAVAETTMKLRAMQNAVAQFSPKHLKLMHQRVLQLSLKVAPPAEHVAGQLDQSNEVAAETAASEAQVSTNVRIDPVLDTVDPHDGLSNAHPHDGLSNDPSIEPSEEETATDKQIAEEAEALQVEAQMEGVPVTALLPEEEEEDVDLMTKLRKTWDKLDLNESAGPMPEKIVDSDTQMYSAISILTALHHIFFRVLESQRGSDRIAVPSSRRILRLLRGRVLRGCIILYQGSIAFKLTDLYDLAMLSGANIIFNTDLHMPTHIIPSPDAPTPPPSSEYHIVDISWLEYAVCNISRPPEVLFTPEMAARRRVFWDMTKGNSSIEEETQERKFRKTDGGVATGVSKPLDVTFTVENVTSHLNLDYFAKESIARSSNFKEASLVFPQEEELAADLLAELEDEF